MATIINVLIDGENREISLESFWKDVVSFGSSTECDIVFPKPYVSKLHGCFYYDKGSWYCKDINSANGIFINGEKESEESIYDGDEIVLGTSLYDTDCIIIRVGEVKKYPDRTDMLKSGDGHTDMLKGGDGRTDMLKGSDGRTENLKGADGRTDNLKGADGRTENLKRADGKTDMLKSGDRGTNTLKSGDRGTSTLKSSDRGTSTLKSSDRGTSTLKGSSGGTSTLKGSNGGTSTLKSTASKPVSAPAKSYSGASNTSKKSKTWIFVVVGLVVVAGLVALFLGLRKNSDSDNSGTDNGTVAEVTTENAVEENTVEESSIEESTVEEGTVGDSTVGDATAGDATAGEATAEAVVEESYYTDDNQLTEYGAVTGVKNYYFMRSTKIKNNEDAQNNWSITNNLVAEGNHEGCIEIEYIAVNSSNDSRTYYYVNKATGDVAIEEYVDGIGIKSSETFNVNDYLD